MTVNQANQVNAKDFDISAMNDEQFEMAA